MVHLGWPFPTALLIAVLVCVPACSPRPMDEFELLAGIEDFEAATCGQSRETVQRLLRDHANAFEGQMVVVRSAVVASTYTRDNPSNLYFGVNYDENDHLWLSEIDPALHKLVYDHHYWVSVVKTYSSRQLSYELPIDEHTFEQLERGRKITFSCTIAALIRGKSVYCAPNAIEFDP